MVSGSCGLSSRRGFELEGPKAILSPDLLSTPERVGHSACKSSKNFTLLEPMREKFGATLVQAPHEAEKPLPGAWASLPPAPHPPPPNKKTSSAGAWLGEHGCPWPLENPAQALCVGAVGGGGGGAGGGQ